MNIPRFAGRFDCGILEYERPRNALTELPPEARDTYRFNKSQIIFDTDEFDYTYALALQKQGLDLEQVSYSSTAGRNTMGTVQSQFFPGKNKY
jgi:hypothetical protein